MTTWSDIDEPVLRFVAAQPPSMPPSWAWRLQLRPETIPSSEVDGLDERQIDEAMLRLQSAGLVDVGERSETIGYATWSRPRVTALGSMVLGVWPDLDRIDAVEALQVSLAALAEHEPDQQRQSALRRAAGLLASLSASVAVKLVSSAADEASGDVF
jgi:hypothetical protein